MPVLLRLETPDYEFTVWAKDISARVTAYQATLGKRAVTALHTEMLFEPSIQLNEAVIEGRVPVFAQSTKQASVHLPSPLFFENTQYQFEWVFLQPVSSACLEHRNEGISSAFRFDPQHRSLARLTGVINTGNDVGWMRLPLVFEMNGTRRVQFIAFEVLPTKMLLHQDVPVMYEAIDEVYPLWRFNLAGRTEQSADKSTQRGYFPLMWLASFGELRQRFEQALKVICSAPHSRLQPQGVSVKAARIKGRVPHKLAERVKQDFANGQQDKKYRLERRRLSVDTPENRFIKMAVSQCKVRLTEFEHKLRISNQLPDRQRLSSAFLDELHLWQQPFQKVLSQSFLQDVGGYGGLHSESLVLQQKTGYSTVYRVWQELKFYLDVLGGQSQISMKSVAEIYEVWCFLCLKRLLEVGLGFELVSNQTSKLTQNDFFEYQMKDGFAGAFSFKRSDGVTARLAHEPKFTKKGKKIRSYLVSQEPDIVLEVTFPKEADTKEQKTFVWLFDAKYRIKTDKSRYDDAGEDVEKNDYVPDDAINQMHRYRDALIHLYGADSGVTSKTGRGIASRAKKSRPVFGAFALYPGFYDQNNVSNPYAQAIEEISIGAFALLPTQGENSYCGHKWLLDYLRSQIGVVESERTFYSTDKVSERLYVQDATRIPYYGMRQVLYPDLTMTIALGETQGRRTDYFEAFKQGTAKWYHLPQATFNRRFEEHVVEEIRYLALASENDLMLETKIIDKLWPIKRVMLLPRCEIEEQKSGKTSDSNELYYLFELGAPLALSKVVRLERLESFLDSIKLTTLTLLEGVERFVDVKKVYEDAIA